METFNLNIIPGKDRPVCHASQYDIGRTIRINLFEGFNVFTLDGTEVISISVRKPDGNVVTESVTNTSDSYVEFVTTEQMTACHGSNLCELKLEKGADVIGTMNFILDVEQDPLEGGVQSASEIYNLQTQVAGMVATEVADQYDSANVIFDAAPTPGHGVGYAVTSEGVATELALKQEVTDNNLTTTDHTIVGAINELDADKQDATDTNLQTTDQTIVGAINELNSDKADAADSQKLITFRNQTLFSGQNVAADTEYNSNGGTIPHVTPQAVAGYRLLNIVNVRAYGLWGSRGLAYAWIESDGLIHFSLYNASARNDALFAIDVTLIYEKV